VSFRRLAKGFGFADERRDQFWLFLQEPFHFNTLFFCAFSAGEPGDFFMQLGWDRFGGATGYFPGVAIEKLQQNFEIIIHG
jgi:hypothetical protein